MFKFAVLLILVIINVHGQNDSVLIDKSEVLLGIGDACESNYIGVKTTGICMPLQNCRTIVNGDDAEFESTECGSQNNTQMACCPHQKPVERIKINLDDNLKCTVANSNKTGVIKFLSDCPELNNAVPVEHVNRICTDEICSDLVCCPVILTSRLKNVCWNVDHPSDTLQLRLLLNQKCTVKKLNITGRYQRKCKYAERNPSVASELMNLCDYDECSDWYCCPIENSDDFDCTGLRIKDSTATLVGPKCIDSKSGRNGTCRANSNCAHDASTLDSCGTYCCTNYFCCPDDQNQIIQSISSRECHSYTKYLTKEEIEVPMNLYDKTTSCIGISTVGGTTADPGEFPHMAALGYKPVQDILWNCSGSLISNQYVLTTGRCLIDRDLGPVQKVRLGVTDLLNVYTWDCPEDFDVAKLIPHPEYSSKFVYNDIGLIELAAQVKFNFHIRPICLPSSPDVVKDYISMGWGGVENTNPTVRLIKIYQDLLSIEECQMQYDKDEQYPNGIMDDTQICTASRISINSSCPEDLGRPLVKYERRRNSLLYIQGIVSFGTACGLSNSSVVHTKVYPYVKWIEEVAWKI